MKNFFLILGFLIFIVGCATSDKVKKNKIKNSDKTEAKEKKTIKNNQDTITKLQLKLKEIEKNYAELQKKIKLNSDETIALISKLKSDTNLLTQTIQEYGILKMRFQTLTAENTVIQEKIKNLIDENSAFHKQKADMTFVITGLNRKIELLNEKIEQLIPDERLTSIRTNNIIFKIHTLENTYDAILIDTKENDVKFCWKNSKGEIYNNINNVKLDIESKNKVLLFATNGGMYTESRAPKGLYIEDGKELVTIDTDTSGKEHGNFYLQPNGVFFIDKNGEPGILSTSEYLRIKFKDKIIFATQSGPMLLNHGVINKNFNKGSSNKLIRSGVGITDKQQVVFIISDDSTNFYDFALLFKEKFNCANALFLDGTISDMYLPEIGRMKIGGDFGPIIIISK